MVDLPVDCRRLHAGSGAAELIVEVARALHGAGAPAHRLEATVGAIGRALDVQTAVFATPTSIFLALDGQTRLLRVDPQDVALADIVAIDAIVADLQHGGCTMSEARARLAALRSTPPAYGLLAGRVAWAGVGGGAAVLFGGGAADVVLAALLSALVGAMPGRLGALLPLVAAATVFMAARLGGLVVGTDVDVVLLAGLVVLLPGFSVTVGLTELATRNLAAGSARLAGAGVTLLQLGVGVALGQAISRHILAPSLARLSSVALSSAALSSAALSPAVETPALGPGSELLAILAAALSFVVLFRARWADLPAIIAVALVAVHGTRLGGALLGSDAAPFIGALAVGLAANIHARLRDVPALILLVPGIILLVPGSLGFRGVSALVEGQGSLLDAARMFLVGASLVAGVLTANAVLPPRRAL